MSPFHLDFISDGSDNPALPGRTGTGVKERKKPPRRRTARTDPVEGADVWRGLIENSPLGYAILQEGRVVFSNRALSDISGFSASELRNLSAEQVAEGIHPDDRQPAFAAMAERLRGKEPPAVNQLRIRHKNGGYRWVETTSARVDLSGGPALQISYMNITARMRADASLRESEAKLRSLIEENIVGIILVDENRQIVEWNRMMEQITGIAGSLVRGRHPIVLSKLLPAAWTPLREALQMLALAQGVSTPGASLAGFPRVLEGAILSIDGAEKMVRTSIFPIPLEQGYQFAGMVEEVTGQRRAEAAYRILVENSLVGFAIIQSGRIVFCNEVLTRLSGYSREETYAQSAEELAATIHPDDRELALRFMQEVPAREGSIPTQHVRLLCKNGDVRRVEALAARTEFDSRPAIQVSYLDVTDRYESGQRLMDTQAKLRSLAVYLLSAREEERKKVAREIHDEIGQVLTALKMDAKWLQKRAELAETKLQEKARGMVDLANQAIETVHRISSELRPGMLDDLGLGAALEWLVSDFIRRTGIPCRMEVSITESRIGGNASTDIFRIAQEALTNVARHARASSASLSIRERRDRLEIEILDDGVGITEAQSAASSSFGLIGIRERVTALGGEASAAARGRRGTALRVSIPLPPSGGLA
jgi:PAS domain S-box-containing protein